MGNLCGGTSTTADTATTPGAAKKKAGTAGSAQAAQTNPTKPKSATRLSTVTVKSKGTGGGGNDKVAKKNGSRSSTIHSHIMKQHSLDVYQKYEELEVLGNGSMGHVAKVVIKKGYDGGSAYAATGGFSGTTTAKDADKAKAFLKAAGLTGSLDSASVTAVKKMAVGTGTASSGGATATTASSNGTANTQSESSSASAGDTGSGTGHGSVIHSTSQKCASCYALKSIILDRVSASFVEELKNEINILKQMDHPNIVKLHEVFSHKKQIYMILELCDGGDMYTRLPYTERESAYHTGKLLSAIKYMHDHGIVHRDLKFENIMFENKSATAEIKVIDFGLSKKFATNKLGVMREGVGTLYSMAPQVLQGVYNSQADMWSVGVITYMLLSSHRPFYNKKRKVMIDRIMRCDYTFNKEYWEPISDDAKDFIDRLLVLDPKVRYNAEKAQQHGWMRKEFKLEDRCDLTGSMVARTNTAMHQYKNNPGLKKLALNVIAHKSSTAEVINLRKAFGRFDTSNDGLISSEEFKIGLRENCTYNDESIRDMFDAIDVNQTGNIMYTEFIAATLEAQGQVDDDRVAEAFDRLDIDNTGSISKENIMEWLAGTDTTMEDVEEMIAKADVDNCGEVSFAEFLEMFRSEAAESSAQHGIAEEEDNDPTNKRGSITKAGASMLASISVRNSREFEEDDVSGIKTNSTGTVSSTNTSTDENLVGIDAVIPGGKFDTDRDESKESR